MLSKLFKNLAKVNILIPGEFRSAKGDEAIKCSVKASDGHLYPLKSSLLFIHKPVIYVKLSDIKYVEFSRIGGMGAGMPASRSFDMTVARINDEPQITFAGIDKQEHKNLINYLKSKGVKMRSVDVETNHQIDLSEGEGDEEEESEQPRSKAPRTGRTAAPDEEDSDEDDESFKEEGDESGGEGGEEEEEDEDEEGSDDGDVEMDEDVDKDELKALQKEAAAIDLSGSRRTRGGARAPQVQADSPKAAKKK